MTIEAAAYPLTWPLGWKRTRPTLRASARFSKGERQYSSEPGVRSWVRQRELSTRDALDRVRLEFQRFGIPDYNLIVSTNVELTRDGWPRSGRRDPDDPGVAVYFRDSRVDGHPQRCIATDRYDRVADNLAAIAATIEAMRSIDRHGGAQIIDRAFAGFAALPSPERHWKLVLGLRDTSITRGTIDSAYKLARSRAHPDNGGADGAFDEVQRAYEQACMEVPE